jgi:hypothetical protein
VKFIIACYSCVVLLAVIRRWLSCGSPCWTIDVGHSMLDFAGSEQIGPQPGRFAQRDRPLRRIG